MGWPKPTPTLSAELAQKKHDWEIYWLNLHPNDKRYSFVDRFTNYFISRYTRDDNDKVLEIGPEPNSAIRYLKIKPQNYHAVERNPEFCAALAELMPATNIHNQDIIEDLVLPSQSFDRIIAAHIFEHILNLPAVLNTLRRLLKPSGCIDVILPCEAGLLYTIGRKVSSEREYRKHFGAGFSEITRSEHVNSIFEVFDEVRQHFKLVDSVCFPLQIPASKMGFQLSLLTGMHLI